MNAPKQEFKILANMQLTEHSSGGKAHALEPMIQAALNDGWSLHGKLMTDCGPCMSFAQAVVRDIP